MPQSPKSHHRESDEWIAKAELFPPSIPSYHLLIRNDNDAYADNHGQDTEDIGQAAHHTDPKLVTWWAFQVLGDWMSVWSLVEVFWYDGAYWCESNKESGDPDTATLVVRDRLIVCRQQAVSQEDVLKSKLCQTTK